METPIHPGYEDYHVGDAVFIRSGRHVGKVGVVAGKWNNAIRVRFGVEISARYRDVSDIRDLRFATAEEARLAGYGNPRWTIHGETR